MKLDIESHFNQQAFLASDSNRMASRHLDNGQHTFSRRLHQALDNKNHGQMMDALRATGTTSQDNPQELISQELKKFRYRDFLTSLFQFLALWFLSNFYILPALLGKNKKKNLILISSPVDSLADPKIFFEVFNSKTGNLFPPNSLILAKGSTHRRINDHFILTTKLIFNAPRFIELSLKDLIIFYRHQIISLKLFLGLILKEKKVSIIYKDFLTYPYIRLLDHKKVLTAYIKTNSEFNDQEFWLEDKNKNFRFYTLYYSLNTITFKYKDHNKVENFQYRISYIEEAFTWSKTHEDWIKRLGGKKIIRVPPILFYKKPGTITPGLPYVILFDVTPYNPFYLKSIFYDYSNNYYSEENCLAFVKDAIESIKKLSPGVRIALKRKRRPHLNNISRYFDFLDSLEKDGSITLLDPDLSAEELIKGAALVISAPYTSTNSIASYHNIPSIYYDSSSKLDPAGFFDENKIDFAQTKEELETKISKYC